MKSTEARTTPLDLHKSDTSRPAFLPKSRTTLAVAADFDLIVDGSRVQFATGQEISFDASAVGVGTDHSVFASAEGALIARLAGDPSGAPEVLIGGFHFAPGGNAVSVAGGDAIPAINPHSCWDLDFCPACDPRGMIYIANSRGAPHVVPFWRDIYFLNTDPESNGTSGYGLEIATGAAPPKGYSNLNYHTATAVLEKFGKRTMSLEEFAASTYGVKERSATARRVHTTGLDPDRTSIFGGMQDTGNLWCWGNDGHVDVPAAALFGGSWVSAADSGSRASSWSDLPSYSGASFGARGCCDHLTPAQPAR